MKHQELLLELLRDYDSFYLYDESAILEHTGRLLEDLPGVEFLYSVKANPAPAVLKAVFSQGFGADAASLAEVERSAELGLPPEKICYSAPGKTEADIAAALPKAILVADSLGEVERIQAASAEADMRARIGIRINPDFSFGGGAGGPSKFGMDTDQAFAALPRWAELPNVEVVGLHVHLRSQELRADILEGYYRDMLGLARQFERALGRPLDFLNLGSGIGIPYAPDDTPLDTAALGKVTGELRRALPSTRILVEVGRYAVGLAGTFVTKVLDRKVSHGETFLILKNTLNGFMRPSLARMVMGHTDSPTATEPPFPAPDAFRFLPLSAHGGEEEIVTLVGSLCTAADIIAKNISLPRLEAGDGIAVTHAGSYAATLTPTAFSSQVPPAELFLTADGQVRSAAEV